MKSTGHEVSKNIAFYGFWTSLGLVMVLLALFGVWILYSVVSSYDIH